MEIVYLIEDQFELRGGLLRKHLLNFFRSKFQNVDRRKRVHKIFEFRVYFTEPLIDESVDLRVFEVLDLNKVVPIVFVKSAPVLLVIDVLSHLGPEVIEVKTRLDAVFVLYNSLLVSKPVSVVAKRECN